MKHTNYPVKKKFPEQWSVKKVMLILFWDMKGLMNIDFLEIGATINSAALWDVVSKICLKQHREFLCSSHLCGASIQ